MIQLARALDAQTGPETASDVFAMAGYADLYGAPPDAMVDERIPAARFAAVGAALAAARAAAVASYAGWRTADYVIAHRIPRVAKALLRRLPRRFAARLLLRAIERNAWTFAGSGVCRTAHRPGLTIAIERNPLTTPGCAWHRGVFERMFGRLIADVAVASREDRGASGAPTSRFDITFA